ncbi:MAG TPA: MotA/TolQ/ExbB proton channel family protein [Pirellulaceae bacterium]|nr:MotA/TolQ/ExbB proton channel family protein [Pirellulaceae bacterium]
MSKLTGILLLCLTSLVVFAAAATLDAPHAAAQEEGAAAVPAEGGHGDEAAAVPHKSRFWWFIHSSGVIGLFILILSIYFIATVIKLFIELKMSVAAPPEEVAMCEQLLAEKNFQGIYDATRDSPTFFARLVSTGIAELPAGLPEARELMDREAEAETVDMERKISMLAVLGSLGPMIGLIGTLKGMIASFAVIALSDTQLKSSEVAGGISEALLLTFEGVALAIPAIFFFAVFRNRVSHLSVETLLLADQFIRKAAQAVKPTRPAAAGPVAAAPAPRMPARTS